MTDLVEGSHAARSTLGGSPFPPIADYGFLSDCEVSALVAPGGNVEWMCLPRMDGPSVFAAMLDRGPVLRYYVEETDDGFSGEEGSTPRRSTRIPDVTSGTSRRPSPTWRSSTRSST
jgi:Trehalase-like, N-terminal